MKKHNNTVNLATRLVTNDAPFAIREAFNQLRTNLMYTISDNSNGAPVIAVTSTNEHAGKSTIITNLAVAFSQLNKKVLLVDGDMRCPVVHKFFELDNKDMGLSELISGIANEDCKHTVMENLDVITSGRIPPNPSELITSPRFADRIQQWKKEYDIIFVDFPPVGIVTDCIACCNNITAYIFVVRAGKCSAKSIKSCMEMMDQVGAKVAGVVLNDYDIKMSDRYKYKYRYRYRYRNSRYVSSMYGYNNPESKND